MSLIDFDKLYMRYTKRWAAENAARIKKDFTPEHFIEEIYAGWLETPEPELGGSTPAEYFAGYDGESAAKLIASYIDSSVPVPSVLLDRAAQLSDGVPYFLDMLKNSGNSPELIMTAINILSELDAGCVLFDALCDIMLSERYPEELRLAASEILADNAECVLDRLLLRLGDRAGSVDTLWQYIADVLAGSGDLLCGQAKEDVFLLLCDLFSADINKQLYAAYLGKFGDERALSLLQSGIAEGINYAEYLEIRSAVERLGGEVTKSFDFSDDPYYNALKNCN